MRDGVPSSERERVKALEREVRELPTRFCDWSAFFSPRRLDRKSKS
jgi:hypothetical protein